MAKLNLTLCSRFNHNDLPILSVPRILIEFLRNSIQSGFGKIISLRLIIRNKGKIRVNKRLYINLFTNTLNALYTDYTYLHIEHGGVIQVEDVAYIASGCKVTVLGLLVIGSETFINARTSILCTEHITIGSHCAISWDVSIIDTDIHTMLNETDQGSQSLQKRPIHIGNHVWIGAGAKILKGVTIGDNSVIAAGSIVTQNVPPHSLAGGVPARVLKKNISWK